MKSSVPLCPYVIKPGGDEMTLRNYQESLQKVAWHL